MLRDWLTGFALFVSTLYGVDAPVHKFVAVPTLGPAEQIGDWLDRTGCEPSDAVGLPVDPIDLPKNEEVAGGVHLGQPILLGVMYGRVE